MTHFDRLTELFSKGHERDLQVDLPEEAQRIAHEGYLAGNKSAKPRVSHQETSESSALTRIMDFQPRVLVGGPSEGVGAGK